MFRIAPLCEEEVIVDVKVCVSERCEEDVKKMSTCQAKKVTEQRWSTRHECQGFKDGVWVEPLRAV